MIGSLVALVIYVIVIGLILWLLSYLVDNVPMQEPFKRVCKIALLVVGVLIVILLLLQFIGAIDGGFPRLGRM